MVTINVIKAFTLNLGGVLHRFEAGLHEIEDEVASHWFVKANAEAVEVKVPNPEESGKTPPAPEPEANSDDTNATPEPAKNSKK